LKLGRVGLVIFSCMIWFLDRLFLFVKQKANNGVDGRTAEVLGILVELTLFPLLPL